MRGKAMPEENAPTVENLIIALNNMEKWCHEIALALEGLGRDTELKLSPELRDSFTQGPPQSVYECT
jgi:hypothetical protein